jgi:hypothetical protein
MVISIVQTGKGYGTVYADREGTLAAGTDWSGAKAGNVGRVPDNKGARCNLGLVSISGPLLCGAIPCSVSADKCEVVWIPRYNSRPSVVHQEAEHEAEGDRDESE